MFANSDNKSKSFTPQVTDPVTIDALPVGDDKSEFNWYINYEKTINQGIYEIQKERADNSGFLSVLLKNVDQLESDLERMDPKQIGSKLESNKVKLINYNQPILQSDVAIEKSEIWKLVLFILVALLMFELFFGWWIGAKR